MASPFFILQGGNAMKKGYAAKLGKCCLGVYISEELNADIEGIAKKKEVAKSYIVREALKDYIQKEKKGE